MPRIPSANPDFERISAPGHPQYRHPIDTRGFNKPDLPIPMAFQITSPFNRWKALLPHALVLHINPSSLSESHNQKVERFQTRGGFVEQHWGQDLIEISADQSTGAFMNIRTGLTSVLRQRTIAWDRFRDLHDLFRNNGSVHDPFGNIVLQGLVLLMYDRGLFFGSFRSFEWEDTEESPFAFKLNWSFKVEHIVMNVDVTRSAVGYPAPAFQKINPSTTVAEEGAVFSSVNSESQKIINVGKEAADAQAADNAAAAAAAAAAVGGLPGVATGVVVGGG